jgi:hypothetical protein
MRIDNCQPFKSLKYGVLKSQLESGYTHTRTILQTTNSIVGVVKKNEFGRDKTMSASIFFHYLSKPIIPFGSCILCINTNLLKFTRPCHGLVNISPQSNPAPDFQYLRRGSR